MKEFGSDFHYIDTYDSQQTHLTKVYKDAILLADGRQCIVVLIRQFGWKRVWVPDYFCYEVIDTIKEQTGIEVLFYEDNPLLEADVEKLPFEQGDVLLRMNFFGIRGLRSNESIRCPVIEDHTHDLLGHWALYSDADWCIASIRKSLPLPEGGMMWSPKGHRLNISMNPLDENERIAAIRWEGMKMKTAYLRGEDVRKDEFHKLYTETEGFFDLAGPSLIDDQSRTIVEEKLDINLWEGAKQRNWLLLKNLVDKDGLRVLEPEDEYCTLFSLVLLFPSEAKRDAVRKRLIEASVYPAILWAVPNCTSENAKSFSGRMLSVHCDGRYTEEDMKELADRLNEAIITE